MGQDCSKTSWEVENPVVPWKVSLILRVNSCRLAEWDYDGEQSHLPKKDDIKQMFFEWFQILFIWNVSVQEKIKQQYKY